MTFNIGDRVKPADTFNWAWASGPQNPETYGTVVDIEQSGWDDDNQYPLYIVKWDDGPYGPFGETEEAEGSWDHIDVATSQQLFDDSGGEYFLMYAIQPAGEEA